MSLAPSWKLKNLGNNFFTVNSLLQYLQLTVKIFQFLRLWTTFLAVLRLSANPIETLFYLRSKRGKTETGNKTAEPVRCPDSSQRLKDCLCTRSRNRNTGHYQSPPGLDCPRRKDCSHRGSNLLILVYQVDSYKPSLSHSSSTSLLWHVPC